MTRSGHCLSPRLAPFTALTSWVAIEPKANGAEAAFGSLYRPVFDLLEEEEDQRCAIGKCRSTPMRSSTRHEHSVRKTWSLLHQSILRKRAARLPRAYVDESPIFKPDNDPFIVLFVPPKIEKLINRYCEVEILGILQEERCYTNQVSSLVEQSAAR